MNFYYLDAIISVGYSVNLQQPTQFRFWATKTLGEIIGNRYEIQNVSYPTVLEF
ncbi:MAG: virulence RhuM family protein [Bacteroidales bacterium]|nr:virulence RhuM family protein [Bacteroidales bacterium]MCF8392007.1 virulence RhuM family protein [Bacteroidales bacterium]